MIGRAGLGVQEAGYTPASLQTALSSLQTMKAVTPQQRADLMGQVTALPEEAQQAKVKEITDHYISLSKDATEVMEKRKPKPPEPYTLNPGDVRFGSDNAEVARVAPAEGNGAPQEYSLNGKNVVAVWDPKARTLTYQGQNILNDPSLGPKVTPRDPLAQELAQQRLDTMRASKEPMDIEPDIRTTSSGGRYVDLSQSRAAGGERNTARAAAIAAGAMPVSKEQADALGEIDTARANQKAIATQIGDLLPKTPGARAGATVNVPLSKVFQTQDQIAAYGSWRTAAINSLRATAGSKGLRINEAEIAAAIENDIPKLTDTVGTARQKLANINTMLDNAERSIIVRNRQEAPAAPPPAPVAAPVAAPTPPPRPAPVAAPPGMVTVTSPSGKVLPPFRTQAEADAFIAKAKAQGLWK
jgi:hypothetical protein